LQADTTAQTLALTLVPLRFTASNPVCDGDRTNRTEVKGTVLVPTAGPAWKIARFASPGLLISVGYMETGIGTLQTRYNESNCGATI
jgi:hypothetical protein